MNIVIVIPYFYPAYIYGGPIFASYYLSQKVVEHGVKVDVITTNVNGENKLDKHFQQCNDLMKNDLMRIENINLLDIDDEEFNKSFSNLECLDINP